MARPIIHQTFEQALQHHQAGRLRDAEQLYDQVLAQNPRHAEATYRLGLVALQCGRLDRAVDLMRRAIDLDGNSAEAYNFLGIALAARGEMDNAIAASQRAVALRPDYAEAHNNLASTLREKRQYHEAIEAIRRAIALRPDYAAAYSNLGNCLSDIGRLDEATVAYRKAIGIKPDLPEAHNGLGIALDNLGQLEESIASHRRAIALRPDYAEAHFNLAAALLARGEFHQGWREYEWRWKCKDRRPLPLEFAHRHHWDGGPLQGRTLLLYPEQGFGDAIQFIRYLPMVSQRGGRILIGCAPQLHRLFSLIAAPGETVIPAQPLPEFDVYCPLLNLPRVFGTTLESIPQASPYLRADPGDVRTWQQRLAEYAPSAKVGLAWAGNPSHPNDHNRSIKLAAFSPLAQVPGVQFVSLQKGPGATQAQDMQLIDRTHDLADFADTAALIANLDLVIAADTAIAHLAGAIGKPVWMLLPFYPDWRWMRQREDSPWYPTMRLFRQRAPGDWDNVVARVAEAFSIWLKNRV